MGRRSPILGYNHNVRYRGVLFHVQTEDSGIVNPHIFSHLFHGGTIVTTRKLVYDPGADDGVIKSLMQAQHKAVMKELRRGVFDDKIDHNLRGTPGLLPRGHDDGASEDTNVGAVPRPSPNAAEQKVIDTLVDRSSPLIQITPVGSGATAMVEITADDEPSSPEITLTAETEPSSPEITVTHHPHMTPPGIPVLDLAPDNTIPTAAPVMEGRHRPVDSVPPLPPPPIDIGPPRPEPMARTATPGGSRRASTPPPMSSASLPPIPPRTNPGSGRTPPPMPRQQAMSAPVVTTRAVTREQPRSDLSQAFEAIQTPPPPEDIAEIHSPALGSATPPPGAAPSERASEYHKRGDRSMRDEFRSGRMPVIADRPTPRPSTPDRPDRPVSGPIRRSGSQPTHQPESLRAGTQPIPQQERTRPGSGPIAQERPRPGSGPMPAQERPRPGSGPMPAQERPRPTSAIAQERPRAGSGPIISPDPARAAARPGTQPAEAPRTITPDPARAAARTATQQAEPARTPPMEARPESRPPATPPPIPPRTGTPQSQSRGTPPDNSIPRTRTPTAPRPFSAPVPTQQRQGSVPRTKSGSGGGVVMSRPAVIVGGRSSTPTPAPPVGPQAAQPEPPRTQTGGGARVRRAREEGGRGVFGQDLISEKSLDEVILAYLSEDASEE